MTRVRGQFMLALPAPCPAPIPPCCVSVLPGKAIQFGVVALTSSSWSWPRPTPTPVAFRPLGHDENTRLSPAVPAAASCAVAPHNFFSRGHFLCVAVAAAAAPPSSCASLAMSLNVSITSAILRPSRCSLTLAFTPQRFLRVGEICKGLGKSLVYGGSRCHLVGSPRRRRIITDDVIAARGLSRGCRWEVRVDVVAILKFKFVIGAMQNCPSTWQENANTQADTECPSCQRGGGGFLAPLPRSGGVGGLDL